MQEVKTGFGPWEGQPPGGVGTTSPVGLQPRGHWPGSLRPHLGRGTWSPWDSKRKGPLSQAVDFWKVL